MGEELCRARARELLDQLDIEEPPVDVEGVAGSLGLQVNKVSRGMGFRGRLLRERMVVEVEQSTHPHMQRFTIAHEVGHWVLGHNSVVSVFNDRSTYDPRRINDRQANVFASELLMPEVWVRAHWAKLRNSQEMAKLFCVSPEAMFYRLEDLNLLGLDPRL